MTKQIAVFVGSASSTSISQIVARYLQSVAPQSIRLNFVEIGDLPLYDRDSDGQNIAQYARVREAVEKADGVLLISPEHNGGVSAMLKNAIDVASRPMGQSKWPGKPAGGVRVTDQLRTICSGAFINMPVAPFAANVGGVFNGVLNERGEIVSEAVQSMLQNFINAYADFVARF
ncbi:NADPH-dependent FMN reductase [Exercitatus varius]|uniref:NADPH-dependent FMN reductase n=1 Tax=Exercitatus varius TaxID=67857 RepID=UPI00294AE61A|nr:NAD(P)H-dependent oxidoreductase [Exercitatus varius]MDG2943287.1 NAD(P)H-dependent oxidoreductase [Exercitatus varius]